MTVPELPVDLYPWFALGSSVFIFAFFTAHVVDARHAYRRHHDDRAAVSMLIAVALAVAGLGLLISAAAAFVEVIGVTGRGELRNVGLGIVRGSLLVTAITLFLVDRTERRHMRPKES